jgi:uncharacterized membrane protein
MRYTRVVPFCAFLLAVAGPATADDLTPIQFPGSVQTIASSINARGEVVGYYYDKNGVHGFLWSGGEFRTIDVPGFEGSTSAHGLNDRGDICGCYTVVHGRPHAFLLRNGQFTIMDVPGAAGTCLASINSRGEMAGHIFDGVTRNGRGLIVDARGGYRIVDGPGAAYTALRAIGAQGEVLGSYAVQTGTNWNSYSFLWKDGVFTTIDLPDGAFSLNGLNTRGELAGTIRRSSETVWRGLILDWTPEGGQKRARYVDHPIGSTFLQGINARGCVVGHYFSVPHLGFQSFLTCPPRN